MFNPVRGKLRLGFAGAGGSFGMLVGIGGIDRRFRNANPGAALPTTNGFPPSGRGHRQNRSAFQVRAHDSNDVGWHVLILPACEERKAIFLHCYRQQEHLT